MGSVIDYIECPNCKQEAFSDFYYKTGEDYINCGNCGYHYAQTLKRDEDGKFVTEDGTKISARPSGTEPKIKFYFSVNAVLPNRETFDEVYANLQNKINHIIAAMQLN